VRAVLVARIMPILHDTYFIVHTMLDSFGFSDLLGLLGKSCELVQIT
jgi:hypothetical protein